MNLRKDHYRNIFFFEEMEQNTSHDRFQVPNGEGSTLSTLGSADDLSGRLSTRTGLRVGEPNATNNPSGSGRRSDALSGVFKAGWPAFIAPRIVLFLFFFRFPCVVLFFPHSKYIQTQFFGLAGHSISDQGLSVVYVASDATRPQTCEKKLL